MLGGGHLGSHAFMYAHWAFQDFKSADQSHILCSSVHLLRSRQGARQVERMLHTACVRPRHRRAEFHCRRHGRLCIRAGLWQ